MPQHKAYAPIIEFSQQLLARHGDSPSGMGWKADDADARYGAMLDVIRPGTQPCTLLDFGCGSAGLLDCIRRRDVAGIEYQGLDLSQQALSLCRQKFPEVTFMMTDVLDPAAAPWPNFDYVVMNGILTYKGGLSHADMFDYCRKLLTTVFDHVDIGLAFNVMSRQVDWERDDLFHVPMDALADFLSRHVSRHFVIRADYGLYEYTVHVYREPRAGAPATRRLVDRQGTIDG